MKKLLAILLVALSSSAGVHALIDGSLLSEVIEQRVGQDAFSCENFDPSCEVMPAVIAQCSGANIFTDPRFSAVADLMNSIIAQNSGLSIWPAPTAIVFGDRNFMAAVNVNNNASGSNIDVQYGQAPLNAAGTVQISVVSDTIPFAYDAIKQSDIIFTTGTDSVTINGDVIIFGSLQLAHATTLTINGSLYLFAGGNDYLELNGSTLSVTGNMYLDGQQAHHLILGNGTINTIHVGGDMFVYNHYIDPTFEPAAVYVNANTSLSCTNLLVCNNQGSDIHGAVLFDTDTNIVASNDIHICSNRADENDGSGSGTGVSISGTLRAGGNIDISANKSGSSTGPLTVGVYVAPTAQMSAQQVTLTYNLGMANSYAVSCNASSFGDTPVYSVNNYSNSGAAFIYNSAPLAIEGATNASVYTGPVPQLPFTGTVLHGACDNTNIPDTGDMVIIDGSLTLTESATIHGNLVIVANVDNYLNLSSGDITVLGDVILDGANSFDGVDGRWFELLGNLYATGNIVLQNNGHVGADTTMNIWGSATISAPGPTTSKSVNFVGNRALGTSGGARAINMAGTIEKTAMCNFIGNTMSSPAGDTPSGTECMSINGLITTTQGSVNIVANTANTGNAVTCFDGNIHAAGDIHILCNSVDYSTAADTSSVCGVQIVNSMLEAGASNSVNMACNSASSVATGQIIALEVGLSSENTLVSTAVTAGQINLLGNIATGTTTGFTAIGLAMCDITGSSQGPCGLLATSGINVVGNEVFSTQPYDATNIVYGCALGSVFGTNSSTYSLTCTGSSSKINVVGNYGEQDYGVMMTTGALIYNSGNNGQINFAINSADIFNNDGIGISIEGSAGMNAPKGTVYLLANSGYDNGVACNTSSEIVADVVDAYCIETPALCYNGQGFGDTNYTGPIPPVSA